MLIAHTVSTLYGEAKNPFIKEFTCGGSSGGDAGLVASGCVPLAVGTDVGGSIRIPAHCVGLVGFKPTLLRISIKGSVKPCIHYSTP